jgi:hypothetical protein
MRQKNIRVYRNPRKRLPHWVAHRNGWNKTSRPPFYQASASPNSIYTGMTARHGAPTTLLGRSVKAIGLVCSAKLPLSTVVRARSRFAFWACPYRLPCRTRMSFCWSAELLAKVDMRPRRARP